jgi:GT2 family glycosyltransferase
MEYTIYVVSNKPHKFQAIQESLDPLPVTFFDGTGYPSFSKLVNECVAQCPTEIVVVLGDKVLPKQHHIQKMLLHLEKGFGFVALYRFACFAFKKELMRQVGMLDERFVGGGFEDYDFYLRLREADIAVYMNDEVPYENSPSSWDYSKTMPVWTTKWKHTWEPGDSLPLSFTRSWPEEIYNYQLGPSTQERFLPFSHSVIEDIAISAKALFGVFGRMKIITNPDYLKIPNIPYPSEKYSFYVIKNADQSQSLNNATYLESKYYNSFSHAVNTALAMSDKLWTVICTDHLRIEPEYIQHALYLLDKGYGFVSLQGCSLLAINLNVINQVGWFDERFTGYGYESLDFILRLGQKQIPVYMKDILDYTISEPTWHVSTNAQHWTNKYTFPPQTSEQVPDIIKHLDELALPYKLQAMIESNVPVTVTSVIEKNDGNWTKCLYELGFQNKIKINYNNGE